MKSVFISKRFYLAVVPLILLFPAHVFPQIQSRIIRSHETSDADGWLLELTEVQVAGQQIDFDKPFSAGDDWLRTLKLKVKNISGKSISFFRISFELFKDKDEKSKPYDSVEYAIQLRHGKPSVKK